MWAVGENVEAGGGGGGLGEVLSRGIREAKKWGEKFYWSVGAEEIEGKNEEAQEGEEVQVNLNRSLGRQRVCGGGGQW